MAIILSAVGGSTTGTCRCTPMLSFMDPLTSLNFGTFICAKERIKTKKAINNVAMSAKVAIQAGAPPLQGGQSTSDTSSTSSATLAIATVAPSAGTSDDSLPPAASTCVGSVVSVTPSPSESSAIALHQKPLCVINNHLYSAITRASIGGFIRI